MMTDTVNWKELGKMGRFSVEVELANNEDFTRARDGTLPSDKVRRVRVQGLVDTGATRLVIPESLAKQLGLQISGSVKVRYADGRVAVRPIAQNIHLTFEGRSSIYDATVEPDRDTLLIGAFVLETLDLLPDCLHQRLVPRDPDIIISEAE